MQNQTFKLSLKPNDYPPNLPFVYADQYDVGRTFVATVYDADGTLYNFTTETVTVVGTKPSGTGFSYAATASGNTVTFETTGQMTVVAGNVTCGIIIEKDGDRIGTLHFVLHIQPAALSSDTIIDSDDFGSIISDAVEEWMDEHGVVIDPTLTVAGAAADAKATGDAIDELKSALDEAIEDFAVPTQEAVDNWLDAHPEATTTVQDGSITASKLTNSLYNELRDPIRVTAVELATKASGVFTLGDVTITAPIQFSRIQNREVTIVNTTFHVQTSVLFPANNNYSYFTLPNFVGCTFINETDGRSLVSSGNTNIAGGKNIGCTYHNMDFAEGTYLQDHSFVGCYIQSYSVFLSCSTNTVQARFVNCNTESDGKALVNAQRAVLYLSGTYEGNNAQETYLITAQCGNMEFSSCWFESTHLLNLIGGTTQNYSSTVVFTSCECNISTEKTVTITNPEYVSLYIIGGLMKPYNSSAIFVDQPASSFAKFIGNFDRTTAQGYNNPIGGVSAEDRQIATLYNLGVTGYNVSSTSVVPSITFKTSKHWGGIFIGYNMFAYLYGTSNGSAYSIVNHWGTGSQPTLAYDSTNGYTITGTKYQSFTFIPSVNANLYFTNVTIVSD